MKNRRQVCVGSLLGLAVCVSMCDAQRLWSHPRSTIVVHVPADAKVFLSDKLMRTPGSVRTYATTALAAGTTLSNYRVRAEAVVDGKTLKEEKLIEFRAGQLHELFFDFSRTPSPPVEGTRENNREWNADLVYLDQGWDADLIQRFYHTPEGTFLLPYSWAKAIVTLSDKQSMLELFEKHGVLKDDVSTHNPDRLPVGFVIDQRPQVKEPWLGVTCAICHVSEIRSGKNRIRVPGGSSQVRYMALLDDLYGRLDQTTSDESKFNQFAEQVLGRADGEGRAQLNESVNNLLKPMRTFWKRRDVENLLPLVSGPYRLDALQMGANNNTLASVQDLEKEPLVRCNAPASYPSLWLGPWRDSAQYSVRIHSPLARNLAQAVSTSMIRPSPNPAETLHFQNLIAIEGWLRDLRPPSWPEDILGPVDFELAGHGRRIFKKECAACHNSNRTEPNEAGFTLLRSIEVPNDSEKMRTDATMLDNLVQSADRFAQIQLRTSKLLDGFFRAAQIPENMQIQATLGKQNLLELRKGYAATALDGIWATPPYLHNGSVPTLHDLLLPPNQRPKTFRLGGGEFDARKVGLVSSGDFVFDTSLPGNSNAGHLWGTDLSDNERWALIEYLKFIQPTGVEQSKSRKPRFDVNDVSWLWPPPTEPIHLDRLISLKDLVSQDGQPVLPQEVFEQLLQIADSDAAAVKHSSGEERRIGLRDAFRNRSVWIIASFRVDPSAPGASAEMRGQFGSTPQIRLIVQPVTIDGDGLQVHDFAVHLIYSYTSGREPAEAVPGVLPKVIPDKAAFGGIVNELARLKMSLHQLGISTDGDLGIHPGLQHERQFGFPSLTDDMKAFLGRHLHANRLTGMAIMGLPTASPEPWIFVATSRTPDGFQPIPIPALTGQTAQMLSFIDSPQVFPVPLANNRNPATNSLVVAPSDRRGASTAALFDLLDLLTGEQVAAFDKNQFAIIGSRESGEPILDTTLRNGDIPDLIGNPRLAHFFNTDCVSCHTATRRSFALSGLDEPRTRPFRFERPKGIANVSEDVLPKDDWNTRNFGWFARDGDLSVPSVPSVTRRTHHESVEVVEFINREYFGHGE